MQTDTLTVLIAASIWAIWMSIMIPGFGIGICYALLSAASFFAGGVVIGGIMFLLYRGLSLVWSKIRRTH